MGIGTSMGAYYDDEFHFSSAQWDGKYDDNIITPNKYMNDKAINSDPANIFDDQGSIVDYDLPSIKPKEPLAPMPPGRDPILEMMPEPLIQQQSMKDMPFPDNRNPDLDFDKRFGSLPPSGILNDLKKPTERPLQRRL